MLGAKKCPYCAEIIFKKAIICKHCKSDLTDKSEPKKIEPKKKEEPTYSEKVKAAIEEEKAKEIARFESLSPEEKELYLREEKRKWRVNTFWAMIGFAAIYFYGFSAVNMWLSWWGFLVLFIGIWLYPNKGEVFFKNRFKRIKEYKGRMISTLSLFVMTLIIFVPLISEVMEEQRILEEKQFIENYPVPTIEVLSSVDHQGDAKEYELEVKVEDAISVYADDKQMVQDTKDKSLYRLTISLDQHITENIDIEAENEYKKATEQILITRNETEGEKTERLARENKAEEKKKEEERIAQEARIERERLAKEAEEKRLQKEKASQDATITQHCEADWPDDFRMRAFCEQQQRNGLNTLNQGKPDDISEGEFSTIRSSCTRDWPDDFRMRAFCEEQQYKAVRELR